MWRTPTRRVNKNDVKEEIPCQVKQFEQVPHGSKYAKGLKVLEDLMYLQWLEVIMI